MKRLWKEKATGMVSDFRNTRVGGVVTRKPPEEGNEGEGSEGEEGGPDPPSNVFFFVLSFVLSPILSFVLSLFPLFFFSFLVLLLFPLFRWLLGVGGRGALLGSAMPV